MKKYRIIIKTVVSISIAFLISQSAIAAELQLNGLYRHIITNDGGIFNGAKTDLVFGLELEEPAYTAHDIISSEGAKRLSVRVLNPMTREDMKTYWSHWLSNAYLRDADTMNAQAWEILALLDSFPDTIPEGTMISFQSNFGNDFSAYIDNAPNFYETSKDGFFNLWLKAWFLTPSLGYDAGNAMMEPEMINPELEALWSNQQPGFAAAF